MWFEVILWVRADCPYCNAVKPLLEMEMRRRGLVLNVRHLDVEGAFVDVPSNVVIIDPDSGEVIDRGSVDAARLQMTPFLEVRVHGELGDTLRILVPGMARYAIEGGRRVVSFEKARDRYVENVVALVDELMSISRSRGVIRVVD